MRIQLLIAATVLVCTMSSPVDAANNCSNAPGEGNLYCCHHPGEEWEQKTIELVTHNNINTLCLHPLSSCTSPIPLHDGQAQKEVRWQLRSLLEEVNSASGMDLHLTLGGESSASPGTHVDNKIFVSAVSCPGGELASADFDGDGVSSFWPWLNEDPWGVIEICHTNASGTVWWTAARFRRVIMHELGHALGMHHFDECIPAGNGVGVMRSTGANHSNIDESYLSYLRDIYGPKQGVATGKFSSSGASWSSTVSAPAYANETSTRFSATNSRSGSNVYLASRDAAKHIKLTGYSGNQWLNLRDLWHPNNAYSPGIASKSDSLIGLFFQGGYSIGDGETGLRYKITTNGGASWTRPNGLRDLNTRQETTQTPGMTATHDVETGKYVTLWRATSHEVKYWVEGNLLPTALSGVFSADTPSIACGPAVDVGVRNCLITWNDRNSWLPGVSWKQCRLVDELITEGGFTNLTEKRFSDCSATRFHGILTVGTASVAYTGPINPWQLALSQGGNTAFTWRKQGPDTASFAGEQSFVTPNPNSTQPEVGSRNAATNRRYIFTGSR